MHARANYEQLYSVGLAEAATAFERTRERALYVPGADDYWTAAMMYWS